MMMPTQATAVPRVTKSLPVPSNTSMPFLTAVQAPAGADWTLPRPPAGHPELQGVWPHNNVTPPERPPEAPNLAGHACPATYAASALPLVLLGPVSARLALDLGVLAGLSVVVLWFVERRLRWRVG